MSFLLKKVEDVTKISKSQSLTSVSIKDCTPSVPNETTTLFLLRVIIKAIFIHTERLLHTFDMWDEVHTVATPMLPGTRLVKADCPDTPSPTLQRRYRSIVGSIGCLVQMTRCDMGFAYGQLSLFLHNPGLVQMAAAERALAYV